MSHIELVDGIDELVSPLGHDDLTAQQVLLKAGRLQQPARDGKHSSHPAVGRIEIVARIYRAGVDPLVLEHLSQLGERENRVYLNVGRVDACPFLGDAGTYEGDMEVITQVVAERPCHCHHRRGHRGQESSKSGLVLANVGVYGWAWSGDIPAPRFALQQFGVLMRDQIGT